MFTGLIEETGEVKRIVRAKDSARLCVSASRVLEDAHEGDSIAVNGVCLTVTELDAGARGANLRAVGERGRNASDTGVASGMNAQVTGRRGRNADTRATRGSRNTRAVCGTFCVDVMHETLRRSSLAQLRAGDAVNLERAMSANGRFGGHIVSGHIDGTGTIVRIMKDDIAIRYVIKTAGDIMRYIVEKGSVAIDGISLTVSGVGCDTFEVSVIPHTQKNTNLCSRSVGDIVNIECDIIGKYVEKMMLAGGDVPNVCSFNECFGSQLQTSVDAPRQNNVLNRRFVHGATLAQTLSQDEAPLTKEYLTECGF